MRGQLQDASLSAAVVRGQVDKILHSAEFSGSEVLRNLFAFLTEHSIERPGEPVKEYELATAVLGKPDGFDPRLDSAVRVHAARLRSKLAEYYMSDGASDPILIEVPKGAYHVAWRYRSVEPALPTETPPHTLPVPPQTMALPKWKPFALGFAAAVAIVGAVAGVTVALQPPKVPPPVETLWQPFFKSPHEPVIVFSNHRFVGTSATGLMHFREGIDSPADSNDTYSGTGTVMAVGQLSNLFSISGHSARLKRAELLTWDEAKDASVVFVGAPDANSRLRELAPLQYFRFKSGYEEPRYGIGAIMNLHPAAGEQPIYFGPSQRPLTFDYAVVAMLPNLNPDRKVVILAGTNTYGCQAAAEFVTTRGHVEELGRRLGVPKNVKFPDFEALLRVTINGGVPVHTQLVTVKRRQTAGSVK
jgi:hypothetical protein